MKNINFYIVIGLTCSFRGVLIRTEFVSGFLVDIFV